MEDVSTLPRRREVYDDEVMDGEEPRRLREDDCLLREDCNVDDREVSRLLLFFTRASSAPLTMLCIVFTRTTACWRTLGSSSSRLDIVADPDDSEDESPFPPSFCGDGLRSPLFRHCAMLQITKPIPSREPPITPAEMPPSSSWLNFALSTSTP